jgi:hypothetical protein
MLEEGEAGGLGRPAELSDADAWIAWKLGLAAFLETRKLAARFPHDPPEEIEPSRGEKVLGTRSR